MIMPISPYQRPSVRKINPPMRHWTNTTYSTICKIANPMLLKISFQWMVLGIGGEEGRCAIGRADALLDALRAMGRCATGRADALLDALWAIGRFAMGRADALLDALRAIGRFAIGKRTGALGGRMERILPQAKRMDWKT